VKLEKNKVPNINVGTVPSSFLIKDNSVPSQQNGATTEVNNLANVNTKKDDAKKTTDNTEIKIDENVAP